MTLVILGLLFGLVGLLWVMVIHMVSMDHRHPKADPMNPKTPITEFERRESKAA